MKRRLTALALCALLCLGLTPALAAESEPFPSVNAYAGFSDVAAGSWYESAVRTCYEVGLMNGTGNGAFTPMGVITIGECAAIAARIRETYTGEPMPAPVPDPSIPWYQHYVDYLTAAGAAVPTPTDTATRAQFFGLLSAVMPREKLPPVNSISSLPDTEDPAVLLFYNAGILTGIDEYGTFNGAGTLTRAECAAMTARIARPALRIHFVPQILVTAAGGSWTSGASAPFIRSYLGDLADQPYFTYGGLAIQAGDFLSAALTNTVDVLQTLYRSNIPFDWSYSLTPDMTVLDYVYASAYTDSARTTWQAAGPALNYAGFPAWAASGQVWKAKHILVATQDEADLLYALLREDPSQFEPLLAVYGTDPGMKTNPDGYVFGPGTMVSEFEEGTKALQPGEVGAPVQSAYGWHIIKRLALTPDDYYDTALELTWNGFIDDHRDAQLQLAPAFSEPIDVPAAFLAYYESVMAS